MPWSKGFGLRPHASSGFGIEDSGTHAELRGTGPRAAGLPRGLNFKNGHREGTRVQGQILELAVLIHRPEELPIPF